MYGQEIARAVYECCDRKIQENSLYPGLKKLTQKGLTVKKSEIVNGKNHDFYQLTDLGIKALEQIDKGFEKLKTWESK